jgi:ketosteroid isomerase-like protein
MSQQNVEAIQSIYTAFEKGDLPGVLKSMAPDIQWNEAENFPYADGNPYIGTAAVVEGVFQRLGSEWEFWKLQIENILDAGDNVVAFGRYKAKNRKTAKSIDAQFAHIWWLKDGKAVRFQQYTDTLQASKALAG